MTTPVRRYPLTRKHPILLVPVAERPDPQNCPGCGHYCWACGRCGWRLWWDTVPENTADVLERATDKLVAAPSGRTVCVSCSLWNCWHPKGGPCDVPRCECVLGAE